MKLSVCCPQSGLFNCGHSLAFLLLIGFHPGAYLGGGIWGPGPLGSLKGRQKKKRERREKKKMRERKRKKGKNGTKGKDR